MIRRRVKTWPEPTTSRLPLISTTAYLSRCARMHRIHSPAIRQIPRSKLGATLLQLHRSLESSHQHERTALKAFEEWQSRWSEQRDAIARRLARLDRELCDLSSIESAPQLLIVNSDDSDTSSTSSEDESVSVRINFPQRKRGRDDNARQ